MKHGASESSDATSSQATTPAPSSPPRTPKTPNSKRRPAYYVQSPSHDGGGGGDKSSSTTTTTTTAHTTPVYSSPLESPSHVSSTCRHSTVDSSTTRFSGTLLRSSSPAAIRSAAGRKRIGGESGKKNKKKKYDDVGGVIDEEEAYEYDEVNQDQEEDEDLPGWCGVLSWLAVLALAFTFACLFVWGIARRYKPHVVAESLTVHNFYAGEGADRTGVPTKLVTLNCSLAMSVHNPSTMFGIHVSSSSIRLMYWDSEIAIATGQLHKFYQPKKSRRDAAAVLHGEKTPLYGAGATLVVANDTTGGKGKKKVPLTLEMAVRSRGHVIGRLVRVRHAVRVRCPVAIDPGSSRPVKFRRKDCSYRYR